MNSARALVIGAGVAMIILGWILRLEARRRVLASRDELTGVLSRRAMLALLEDRMRSAAVGGAGFSVILLDVDHMKEINDRFGHEAGDRVLVRVAAALQSALRPGDRLGRVAGDEFAAMLPGTPVAAAHQVADSLCAALAAVHPDGTEMPLPVTVSGGVTAWVVADGALRDLLRRAEDAISAAKAGGRNRVMTG